MSEELNQKISQLLDDDLTHQEAMDLLVKLQLQPHLRSKMSRYEAISHALKSETFIPVQSEFAQSVSRQIKTEPAYAITRRKPVQHPYFTYLALAASVAVVAVLMSHRPGQPERMVKPSLMAASPAPSVEYGYRTVSSSKPVTYAQNSETYQADSRFTEYLQAHNSSRYIGVSVNLQPYARVVSYSQE